MPAVSVVSATERGGDLLGGQVGAALLGGLGDSGSDSSRSATGSPVADEVAVGRARSAPAARRSRRSRPVPPARAPGPARPRPTSRASSPPLALPRSGCAESLAGAPTRSAPTSLPRCDDLRRRARPAPPGRPGPAAGDLLRPGHGRAGRAVGDDVRQLGRQDRLAAGRGARPRARRRSLRVDLPTHWLGPVFLGAAWTVGLAGHRRPTNPTPWSAARTASRAGRRTPTDLPVLACSLLPMGVRFADPLPAGVHDVGRRGLVAAGRVRALGPARPATIRGRLGRRRRSPTTSCGAGPPPGPLALRRRPAPLDGEPGFPIRSRRLHGAAGGRRLRRARLWLASERGPDAGAVERGAVHGPLRAG